LRRSEPTNGRTSPNASRRTCIAPVRISTSSKAGRRTSSSSLAWCRAFRTIHYSLTVRRIHPLEGGSAVVEIAESLDLGGVQTEIPEAIFFDFDGDGRIRRVDIYIKKPPT
jgi:hypothetical protein